MDGWGWLLGGIATLSALYWCWGCVALALTIRGVPRLGVPATAPAGGWPRVSVIIAARNEAATLATALASRLADDYPDLELVVVDDRSTDDTGAIIDRCAATDSRVRPVHVTALPAGWLGKVHALETGRRAATGDWLLFSDADVQVRPGALRASTAWAEANGVDHVCVLAQLWPATFVLDAALSGFWRFSVIAGCLWRVPNPRSNAFAGMGAWNQVRRAAFDRTPGFEWLKMAVVDDAALGRMVKQHGARSALVNAPHLVGLRMYRSIVDMAHGVEKNAFALIGRFSLWRTAATCVSVLAIELGMVAALLPGAPPVAWAAGAVATAAALGMAGAAARWMHRPLGSALCFPLATVVLNALVWRSGWLGWRRGGVWWRDTFYANAELREALRLFD